jgi:DNA-binding NarL/FixJ family response regulator
MKRIAVLIADDHAVVRHGLRAVLGAEPDICVVGEAADSEAVLSALQRWRVDVLVLDLMMPGRNGFELMKLVARRRPAPRIVVLTMHATEAYVIEALRHGALGYVVKDASTVELLAAVRDAARGRQFIGSPFSASGIEAYARRVEAASQDPYDALTNREREVLQLAADGLTNHAIAARLAISRRTAESHRASLMRKLGLKRQQDLIRYALRRGISPL